jgi:hypothetical protein
MGGDGPSVMWWVTQHAGGIVMGVLSVNLSVQLCLAVVMTTPALCGLGTGPALCGLGTGPARS